jgi:predicted GNAT family N-acyltransferase
MKIQEISSEIDSYYLDAIAKLRVSVWSNQLGQKAFLENQWCDEHDQHAFHWIVINTENELIASARLCLHNTIAEFPDFQEIRELVTEFPPPIAMMTRLVISPNYQKLGISKILDLARIKKAEQLGAKSIVLQVPFYRIKSIEKFGFKCVGKAQEKTFNDKCEIEFFLYAKTLTILR